MSDYETIEDIFNIWPSVDAMAQDLNKLPQTVRRWQSAGRIPPHLWCDVIEAAATRGQLVTATDILRLFRPKVADGWPRGKPRRRQAVSAET